MHNSPLAWESAVVNVNIAGSWPFGDLQLYVCLLPFMCKMSHFLWIWEGLDDCDVRRLLGTNQLLYGCFPATKDGVMSVFLKIAIPLANSISQNSFCSLESIFYSYYSNNVLVEFFKSRSGIWQGSMCYSSAWWCMRTWVRKKAVQDVWSNTALLNTARWRLPHSSCPTAVNGWVHKILTQSFMHPKCQIQKWRNASQFPTHIGRDRGSSEG